MYKCLFCTVLILLVFSGCNNTSEPVLTETDLARIANTQNIGLVETVDGLSLMVGGTEITSNEIINEPTIFGEKRISPIEYFKPDTQTLSIEQFKEQKREILKMILWDKISDTLLYQHAKRQLGDNIDETLERAAESELKRLIQQYGGDIAKVDEALRKSGYDRTSYKDYSKRRILIDWYISTLTPKVSYITHRRLKNKYDNMKDAHFAISPEIQFRLIDIQPARLEIQDPNQIRSELAENLANEILTRLKSGEDFEELAKEYSYGPRKDFGGLWIPVNPESLAGAYNSIAKSAQSIAPGEIAGPIITDEHIFIMKLEKKQVADYIPFEQVQDQVREALILEQNENTVIDKLSETIGRQMTLSETNKFIDSCLEKIYRLNNP